ncbi:MAG: hypothetical protein ILO34_08170 [Kiritimatiellae bacterium]|nr:hypothetical protein [Kiritimatiellia bacterium]
MKIKCFYCKETLVVSDDIVEGQHILCPFCARKFSYGDRADAIPDSDLKAAIQVCCRDKKQNEYYMKAPCGARLHIALIFYGKVFKDTLDQKAYLSAVEEVSKELKERDLLYLLRYEDDQTLKSHWLDRLVSEYGYEEIIPEDHVEEVYADESDAVKNRKPDTRKPGRANTKNLVLPVVAAGIAAVLAFFMISQMVRRTGVKSRIADVREDDVAAESVKETAVAADDAKEQDERRRELLLSSCATALEEVEEMQKARSRAKKALDEDIDRFQRELSELSQQNHFRAGKAQAERKQRFNTAEYAMMIAESPIVKELSHRYAGDDLVSRGAAFKAEILSELKNSGAKMQAKSESIGEKSDEFIDGIVQKINDGINERGNELAQIAKDIAKISHQANQADMMTKLGALSEAERFLAAADEARREEISKKLAALPMDGVAAAYAGIGQDVFVDMPKENPSIVDHDDVIAADDRRSDGNSRSQDKGTAAKRDDGVSKKRDNAPFRAENKKANANVGQVAKTETVKEVPKKSRKKCKSPERCTNFAENGQNFCEAHKCDSYGCKEHRATLTIPGWFDVDKDERITGKSIKRDFRKLRIPYCKKHMCKRQVVQPNDRKTGRRHSYYISDYYSDRLGAQFFFCTNERLAKGSYCIEHSCKVSTCNSPKWEYWVEASADDLTYREFYDDMPTSLTEYRGLRLKRASTCRGHSSKDPETIRDRDEEERQTEGDRRRAKELRDD